MKRMILLALATVLVLAAIAGVFIVHSHTPSPRLMSGHHVAFWMIYRDPLGLYTINYPTGWKVNDISSNGEWMISNTTNGGQRFIAASWDTVSLSDSANRYEAIQIRAIELSSTDARTYFCKPGTPTSPNLTEHGGTTFNTGNANIQVLLGFQGDPLIPIDPTTTAQVHAAVSPSTYAPILTTFHSLAPAGSDC